MNKWRRNNTPGEGCGRLGRPSTDSRGKAATSPKTCKFLRKSYDFSENQRIPMEKLRLLRTPTNSYGKAATLSENATNSTGIAGDFREDLARPRLQSIIFENLDFSESCIPRALAKTPLPLYVIEYLDYSKDPNNRTPAPNLPHPQPLNLPKHPQNSL